MTVTIRKMKVDDLIDVKGVDLVCWTDLFEKQYGIKDKISPRTDQNLLSYLHSDVDGAFVASDIFAGIIGLSFSHTWGTTGWIGPLSVLPSYQAKGVGKELLKHSLRYLEDQGCVDIGLETMPENATNLGMYLKVGLRPEGLVVVFGRTLEDYDLEEEPSGSVGIERLSESPIEGHMLGQIRRISNAHRPGLDYTKEVLLTKEFSFGDTLVATSRGKVQGFSIVHTAQKREGMPGAAIRALVVDVGAKAEVLESLLATSELMAADAGLKEISVAIPTVCRRAVDSVFSRGYQVVQSFERLIWLGSSDMNERLFNLCTWSG
jgi:ribosomal protein S18 acetylase RimI-like enzyme